MLLINKVLICRLWHELITMVKFQWKPKNHFVYYFIIFTSGVICSFIVFSIMSSKATVTKSRRNPMTFENFLQVRDEYPVLSPYYDGMDSGGGVERVRKSKASRGKTKPEGI